MIKATFYLPLKDNDGSDLGARVKVVEQQLFDAFGAFMRVGHFKGEWCMRSGERKMDTSAVYMIIMENDRVDTLVNILKVFKAGTAQESIFLEVDRDVDLILIE